MSGQMGIGNRNRLGRGTSRGPRGPGVRRFPIPDARWNSFRFPLAILDNEPVREPDHAACSGGEREVVRDEHDTRSRLAVELLDQLHDATAGAPSRFPVGSSAKRMRGRFENARAMATRCCSPPDS